MSFSFSVDAKRPFSAPAVIEALEIPDIRAVEELPLQGDWPEGCLHLFVAGRSTRGVECGLEGGEFSVRLMLMANAEDFELGLQLLEAVSASLGVPINAEDHGEPVSLGEFRGHYDSAWVQDMLASAPNTLVRMVERENGTFTIPGILRPYHLGPRRISELRSSGPPSEFGTRLYEDVRHVQFVDLEEYYEAGILSSKGADGKAVLFTAWTPKVRYWFPKVDYFVIETDDHPFVHARVLLELSPDKLKWLDEAQALVEPFSDAEWAEFVERTRPLRANPLGQLKPPAKPATSKSWWQFWK